jgi:hypothetical protein
MMLRNDRSVATIGVIGLMTMGAGELSAQTMRTETLTPITDTFTREEDRSDSYGTAGAMHVSGTSSQNMLGFARGEADSWIRFDAAEAIVAFDGSFGRGAWQLDSAVLMLEEVSQAAHPMFNQGTGEIDVTWVGRDDWSEGAGFPNQPAAAFGIVLSYNSARSRLDASADEVVGNVTNRLADGVLEIELVLERGFTADVISGDEVTLVLSTTDRETGFTFHSRDWPQASGRPMLMLTASRVDDDAAADMVSDAEDGGGADGSEDNRGNEIDTPPITNVMMCGADMMTTGMMLLGGLGFVRVGRRCSWL